MRMLLAATVLALVTSGCATRFSVPGTVSYTATPPVEGNSGALPLSALYCHAEPETLIQLGPACVLRENYLGLHPLGECRLPTSAGLVPLRVQTAMQSAQVHMRGRTGRVPLEVVLGGTTPDGRYLTYHFTEGGTERDATSEECEALLGPGEQGGDRRL